MGFTGSFSLNNWELYVQGSTSPSDPDCNVSLDACVDFTDPAQGSATLIRYTDGSIAPGNQYATWSWLRPQNDQAGYFISFDYNIPDPGIGGDAYGQYIIGNSTSSELRGANNISPVYVAAGQNFSFRITISGTASVGSFEVSNFSAVPGPLPAAGAATAFGYSRRLRRRIKGELPAPARGRSAPPHPSSYLDLNARALQSLPLSFSYGSRVAASAFPVPSPGPRTASAGLCRGQAPTPIPAPISPCREQA